MNTICWCLACYIRNSEMFSLWKQCRVWIVVSSNKELKMVLTLRLEHIAIDKWWQGFGFSNEVIGCEEKIGTWGKDKNVDVVVMIRDMFLMNLPKKGLREWGGQYLMESICIWEKYSDAEKRVLSRKIRNICCWMSMMASFLYLHWGSLVELSGSCNYCSLYT